jgi:hypothetical protein
MRFRRTLAIAAASAAAAIGFATSVSFPAITAHAATTSVQLPISVYSHMLIDPLHRHIFITSGTGSSSILVTDYSGQTVATIPNEPGATGLALSSDGSTVYAALADGDAVSAISTSTLTETARYDTGTGTTPTHVAYTSRKIWFGYNGGITTSSDGSFNFVWAGIGSIDPSTSAATVTLNATNDPANTWSIGPMLSATPNGELVAGEPVQSPLEVATYDVSSGTPSVLAPPTFWDTNTLPNAGNLGSLAITPDGKDVVIASASPYYHQVYRISDLSPDGTYPTTNYPNSVSISGDGFVAAGTSANNEVLVFSPGGSTPLNTYNFGSNWLATDGVAITPDGRELFTITATDPNGDSPTLNVNPDPEAGPSTLSLTGPATARHHHAITLTGTLGGASPYIGGQTLRVTRIDPANPSGVALPDVTTAADGSFSITDTPPKANVDTGTVTYQVSYAGDTRLSASSARFSVTVHYNGS